MPQPAKKTLIVLYYQVAGIEMVKMMQPSSPGPDLSYLSLLYLHLRSQRYDVDYTAQLYQLHLCRIKTQLYGCLVKLKTKI